jgi:rhamnose transport system substrate-binding protein
LTQKTQKLFCEPAPGCGSKDAALLTNGWRAKKCPGMKMIALRPCDDLKDRAQPEATALISANPQMKLIMAICSPAVPGAEEAVKQAGKVGQVKVIGLGLPNENRRYVKEGVTDSVILWTTEDSGYSRGAGGGGFGARYPQTRQATFAAGSLGTFEIKGDNILLGTPFVFNKDNIDQFDF